MTISQRWAARIWSGTERQSGLTCSIVPTLDSQNAIARAAARRRCHLGRNLRRADGHRAARSGVRSRAGIGLSNRFVYVGTLGDHVIVLDRNTGKEAWRFQAAGPITSTPVLAGKLLLVASRGSWITALDALTGKERWARYDWFSWIESTGVVRGDIFYVGSSDLRAVRALDARAGKTLWETDELGWAWGTPFIEGDTIYIGVAGPQTYVTKHAAGLVAVDRRTGKVKWRRPVLPDPGTFVSGYPGSVTVHEGVLVAPNVRGVVEGYKVPVLQKPAADDDDLDQVRRSAHGSQRLPTRCQYGSSTATVTAPSANSPTRSEAADAPIDRNETKSLRPDQMTHKADKPANHPTFKSRRQATSAKVGPLG